MRRIALTTAIALLAAASPALAARTNVTIRGAGFGHGIGLSQYGAFGYAVHGASYKDIVDHYYTGTHVADVGGRTIRVLLQSGPHTIWFTGATAGAGHKLDPGKRYRAVRHGINQVELQTAGGKKIEIADAPLTVSSSRGYFALQGRAQNGVSDGSYRGALELRPALFGGMTAVDALPLDQYVQGVVPGEVPSAWPPAALEAQAVVARSYSLVTDAGGAIFDQYADTRSQMYTGMARETPGTNAAVSDTSGQVVKYGNNVAVTYYFSTSGGETENIENVFIGSRPVPYLKAVKDPYDSASPRHRWRFTWSKTLLDRKLGSWVKGKLRAVNVIKRGVSPRIVSANIVGTRGTTAVTGPELRTRLGLFDTWAYFVGIKSGQGTTSPQPAPQASPNGGTIVDGGASATTSRLVRLLKFDGPNPLVFSGTVTPRPKHVTVQQIVAHKWKTIGRGRTDRLGRYAMLMPGRGLYRVLANGAVGPTTRIR